VYGQCLDPNFAVTFHQGRDASPRRPTNFVAKRRNAKKSNGCGLLRAKAAPAATESPSCL
jgi:hypothetical protein